jgi:rhodanese-related sulfurtransferase
VKNGYTNVYWFPGGISEWRSFNYPLEVRNKYRNIKVHKLRPNEVQDRIAQGDVLIIDVRPRNFSKDPNFILGAKNFPLLTLVADAHLLPKDQPIILTDWTMRQAPLAAKYLAANGFMVLGVLKGGLIRWESEGLPVERRDPVKE